MPVSPTLPAGTALGMSFEMGVDINIGTEASPVWLPVRRPTAISQAVTPKMADSQTYDDFGADNADRIGESFVLSFAIQANQSASTGLYLPEVEKLKSYTEPNVVGPAAVAQIRWYHKPSAGTPNPNDAYMGFATVGIDRANTGNADTGSWAVTLTGKGARTQITNPYGGQVATAPTVVSATPSGAAAGAQVTITGSQFLTATSVLFAAVVAPVKTIVSGSTIIVVVPAGTAGSAPITVVNPIGTSPALAYTRA